MVSAAPSFFGPVLLCMGTRPEIIKMAPVALALRELDVPFVVLHTGQHEEMAWPLYEFFGIQPQHVLCLKRERVHLSGLGAELLGGIAEVIAELSPRHVLVHGDTLSALMAAQAAYFARVPVSHVEAGLRTGDPGNPFPEEKSRELIARLAAWHFAPTRMARTNLLAEGIHDRQILVTGNTVVDATLEAGRRIAGRNLDSLHGPEVGAFMRANARRPLLVVSAHRRENWGAGIAGIAQGVRELLVAQPEMAVLWTLHPNPVVRNEVLSRLGGLPAPVSGRLCLVPPMDYPSMIGALRCAWMVLTDSGGLQEEAATLGTPVLVLREVTERPELIACGFGAVVGTRPEVIRQKVTQMLQEPLLRNGLVRGERANPFGDGQAAKRIARHLSSLPGVGGKTGLTAHSEIREVQLC